MIPTSDLILLSLDIFFAFLSAAQAADRGNHVPQLVDPAPPSLAPALAVRAEAEAEAEAAVVEGAVAPADPDSGASPSSPGPAVPPAGSPAPIPVGPASPGTDPPGPTPPVAPGSPSPLTDPPGPTPPSAGPGPALASPPLNATPSTPPSGTPIVPPPDLPQPAPHPSPYVQLLLEATEVRHVCIAPGPARHGSRLFRGFRDMTDRTTMKTVRYWCGPHGALADVAAERDLFVLTNPRVAVPAQDARNRGLNCDLGEVL